MTGGLESETSKVEKGTFDGDIPSESDVQISSGRHELALEASGSDSKAPSVNGVGQALESLPEIETPAMEVDLPDGGDDLDELKKPSSYEYVDPPREIELKGGETLDTIAEANLKDFLGDDYESITQDPLNKRNFLNLYKNSLAFINGASEDTVFKNGDKITLPGRNSEGEAIYINDGATTTWGGNTVTTLDSSGVRKIVFDDGSYQISKPDGTQESRDVFGIVANTRQLENGDWMTTRSDGTYRRVNYEKDTFEELTHHGVLSIKDETGKFTVKYKNGDVSETYPDGRSVVTQKDNTVIKTDKEGVSEIFDSEGNLTGRGLFNREFEVEFGGDDENPEYNVKSRGRPEFNFTLTKSDTGELQLTESDGESSLGFLRDDDFRSVEEERNQLLASIESGIEHPIMRAKFQADMIRFENRAKARDLPAEAVLDSYKAINKLFAQDGDPPINSERRVQIASELISDLAEPYTIAQGGHGTCNVKVLHVAIAAKHPARIANLVTEAATTGKYTLPDGEVVDLPPATLKPSFDARRFPRANGDRGFAGQLFDSAVINALYQREGLDYRFENRDPEPDMLGYKTGDLHVDKETGQPLTDPKTGKVKEYGGLITERIVGAYRLIMGDNDASVDWLLDPNLVEAEGDGIRSYNNQNEFAEVLTELKEKGAFPMPLMVNARMAPFWIPLSRSSLLGSEGGHMVNITDFDPESGRVKIDNQWNTFNDKLSEEGSVPLEKLYYSSLTPTSLLFKLSEEALTQSEANRDSRSISIAALRRLSTVLEDSDPALLNDSYNGIAVQLGGAVSETKYGDPENLDYMKLYGTLRPSAKLAMLQTVSDTSGIPEAIPESTFDQEILGLVEYFQLMEADILRGLENHPLTEESGKELFIINPSYDLDEVINEGKLNTIGLIAGLSDEHRTRLMEKIRVDDARRRKEAREFARATAE